MKSFLLNKAVLLMFVVTGWPILPNNSSSSTFVVEKEKIVEQPVLLKEIKNVVATVYRANKRECDNDFLTTASGFKLDSFDQYQHRIIAISRNLRSDFKWGDSVYVVGTEYDGWWKVEDAMNARWQNKIDLLINHDMPINKWKNVRIYKRI